MTNDEWLWIELVRPTTDRVGRWLSKIFFLIMHLSFVIRH